MLLNIRNMMDNTPRCYISWRDHSVNKMVHFAFHTYLQLFSDDIWPSIYPEMMNLLKSASVVTRTEAIGWKVIIIKILKKTTHRKGAFGCNFVNILPSIDGWQNQKTIIFHDKCFWQKEKELPFFFGIRHYVSKTCRWLVCFFPLKIVFIFLHQVVSCVVWSNFH